MSRADMAFEEELCHGPAKRCFMSTKMITMVVQRLL